MVSHRHPFKLQILFSTSWSTQVSWVDCVNAVVWLTALIATRFRGRISTQNSVQNGHAGSTRMWKCNREPAQDWTEHLHVFFTILSNYMDGAGVTQTWASLWAEKATAEFLPPTQTSSLEHRRWRVTNSWMNWHEEKDYWAFPQPIHYISAIFTIERNVSSIQLF